MGQYLEAYRPSLLIEILYDAVAEAVEALLPSGYHFYKIDDSRYQAKQHPHLFRDESGSYNWLICRPQVAQPLAAKGLIG